MGVIKLQANCCDFNKNSRSMVLIILLTLIITVGKIILNYHFKAHFSPVFLFENPPGNFLFFLEILHSDNFSMKQKMWIFKFTSTVDRT